MPNLACRISCEGSALYSISVCRDQPQLPTNHATRMQPLQHRAGIPSSSTRSSDFDSSGRSSSSTKRASIHSSWLRPYGLKRDSPHVLVSCLTDRSIRHGQHAWGMSFAIRSLHTSHLARSSSDAVTSSSAGDASANASNGSTTGSQPQSERSAIGSVRADMGIVFTCSKCDTRSVKAFSRAAYTKGVVLVRCPGCQSHHLIADHLGFFGEKGWTVESLEKEQGVRVRRMSATQTPGGAGSDAAAAVTVTAEDWAGWSRVEALVTAAQLRAQGGDSDTAGAAPSATSSSGRGQGQMQGSNPGGDAATAAAVTAADGVLSVTAEDMEAWRKVQAGAGAGKDASSR